MTATLVERLLQGRLGGQAAAPLSESTPGLTLEQAYLDDAMLAYEMDGKPLRREPRAPVRVVIPEMYGYKNVKWVERIVVARRAQLGYWEQRGYDVDAWVGRSNAA